mmetsp:Transcript_36565/g.108659  ORF Transcript_36565/g.108659 Transcript_36565/m.108659 type:complete len:215 (-) Transcript_36565:225-869(-)
MRQLRLPATPRRPDDVVDDMSEDILDGGAIVMPLRPDLVEALVRVVGEPEHVLVRSPPVHPVGAVELAGAKHLAQDALLDTGQHALASKEDEAEDGHGLFDRLQCCRRWSFPDVEPDDLDSAGLQGPQRHSELLERHGGTGVGQRANDLHVLGPHEFRRPPARQHHGPAAPVGVELLQHARLAVQLRRRREVLEAHLHAWLQVHLSYGGLPRLL